MILFSRYLQYYIIPKKFTYIASCYLQNKADQTHMVTYLTVTNASSTTYQLTIENGPTHLFLGLG